MSDEEAVLTSFDNNFHCHGSSPDFFDCSSNYLDQNSRLLGLQQFDCRPCFVRKAFVSSLGLQPIQVLARLAHQQDAFGFSVREGFDVNRDWVAVAEVDLLADFGGDL